jgi:hypothetical protein
MFPPNSALKPNALYKDKTNITPVRKLKNRKNPENLVGN